MGIRNGRCNAGGEEMTTTTTEAEYTRQEMIRTQKDIRSRLIYMESDDMRRAKRTLRYLESVLNGKEEVKW